MGQCPIRRKNMTHSGEDGRGDPSPASAVPKIPTGNPGLDTVLEGGLPRGRTTLFNGGPGTGKTVLAMEFLYRGALAGEPGLFVSFEERSEDLRANAAAMGMDIAAMETAGKLKCLHAEVPHEAVKAGAFDLQGLLAIIEGHARALKTNRIVLDAIDVLMRFFGEPERERKKLYVLNDWLRDRGMTAVLTVKAGPEPSQRYPFLDFMADCVLLLDQRIVGQVRTRRLTIVKYRGSPFLSNEHPYVITPHGMVLIPVSSMTLEQSAPGRRLSSGCESLDECLGGGFQCGTSILLAGASGTGKTTLACLFVREACRQTQRVLYVTYEESQTSLFAGMLSVGIDLQSAVDAHALRVLTLFPESTGIDGHLLTILDAIDAFGPAHIVIDAISACDRMGSEQAAFDFLIRLIMTCRGRGITCLYTNQTSQAEAITRISGVGISSLVDTLIALQYWDDGRELRRRLLVVKSRGSRHSMAYHPFTITDNGLAVTPREVNRRGGEDGGKEAR